MWDTIEISDPAGLLIDQRDQEDMTFWSLVFDVSCEELEHAISLVGPSETAVRGYLSHCRPVHWKH